MDSRDTAHPHPHPLPQTKTHSRTLPTPKCPPGPAMPLSKQPLQRPVERKKGPREVRRCARGWSSARRRALGSFRTESQRGSGVKVACMGVPIPLPTSGYTHVFKHFNCVQWSAPDSTTGLGKTAVYSAYRPGLLLVHCNQILAGLRINYSGLRCTAPVPHQPHVLQNSNILYKRLQEWLPLRPYIWLSHKFLTFNYIFISSVQP